MTCGRPGVASRLLECGVLGALQASKEKSVGYSTCHLDVAILQVQFHELCATISVFSMF